MKYSGYSLTKKESAPFNPGPKIQREPVHPLSEIRHHPHELALLYDPGAHY